MIWNWLVTHINLEFAPWEYNFLAVMFILFLLRLMYGVVDLIDAKENKLQAETKLIETEIEFGEKELELRRTKIDTEIAKLNEEVAAES